MTTPATPDTALPALREQLVTVLLDAAAEAHGHRPELTELEWVQVQMDQLTRALMAVFAGELERLADSLPVPDGFAPTYQPALTLVREYLRGRAGSYRRAVAS